MAKESVQLWKAALDLPGFNEAAPDSCHYFCAIAWQHQIPTQSWFHNTLSCKVSKILLLDLQGQL